MSNTPIRNINDPWFSWMRNVVPKYQEWSNSDIKQDLQINALPAALLMLQIEHDFNFGAIIRVVNNFNLSRVYYYGKKHYDKRGAVGTYNYTDVKYLPTFAEVVQLKENYRVVGLENNMQKPTIMLNRYQWQPNSLLVIGEEKSGITSEFLELCDDYVEIPTLGSVRSLNAAVAAGIAISDYYFKGLKQ